MAIRGIGIPGMGLRSDGAGIRGLGIPTGRLAGARHGVGVHRGHGAVLVGVQAGVVLHGNPSGDLLRLGARQRHQAHRDLTTMQAEALLPLIARVRLTLRLRHHVPEIWGAAATVHRPRSITALHPVAPAVTLPLLLIRQEDQV